MSATTARSYPRVTKRDMSILEALAILEREAAAGRPITMPQRPAAPTSSPTATPAAAASRRAEAPSPPPGTSPKPEEQSTSPAGDRAAIELETAILRRDHAALALRRERLQAQRAGVMPWWLRLIIFIAVIGAGYWFLSPQVSALIAQARVASSSAGPSAPLGQMLMPPFLAPASTPAATWHAAPVSYTSAPVNAPQGHPQALHQTPPPPAFVVTSPSGRAYVVTGHSGGSLRQQVGQ
jgi:hypothetical protein